MILLVVWSVNSDGSAHTSKASFNLLIMLLTYGFVPVIVSSIQINRATCTFNKNWFTRRKKVFLEKAVVEQVYEFLPQMFEKVSRKLKYDLKVFLVHKHI